jgi:hypothetical protein
MFFPSHVFLQPFTTPAATAQTPRKYWWRHWRRWRSAPSVGTWAPDVEGGNQMAHMFFDTFFDGCSWIRFINVYLYVYIYIITYTEKQCIQHIHVYTMIVRIYNMIYVYYYVSYIDSRFTKQNCVGKGKLALMVCRQCWQTYIFRTMAAQHPPAN